MTPGTDAFKRTRCIHEIRDKKTVVIPGGANQQDTFNFDFVGAEETNQEEIFNKVGKTIVDQCLQGYNGSIFAYGQTGSGKTHTIQGNLSESAEKSERGLLPRCFEYIFAQMCKIKNNHENQLRNGKRSARHSGLNNLPKTEDNCE